MRYLIALIFITFIAMVQAETAAPLQPTQLLGTWQVDLRPTPDAKPYFQQFAMATTPISQTHDQQCGKTLSQIQ